ncbi:MAG: 6-phosphofructokinase [Chloroflexota bacterium]
MNKIGVLTSGGDAPGMNAAVRAVVRAGLDRGFEVFAIYEGYQGMVDGGERIQPMSWSDVGGILHRGGTIIGTARCLDFLERSGRLRAVKNLIEHGIDNLVVIGGDGSLTGAHLLCAEWASLLNELVEKGEVSEKTAVRYKQLTVMGLVGSIDNDMWGTDISIGADTALHRITDAVDAISSTAASHQRSFVVEVMGRHCGYLALMSALATGADWVLIPESPPNLDAWENKMCEVLQNGRRIGRRDSIVIVAEGAKSRRGDHISCEYVKEVLETQLNEDARVTKLGHVQRGGAPSAFDRNLSTMLGSFAVEAIDSHQHEGQASLIGIQGNKICLNSLEECLSKTKEVNQAIKDCNFDKAMALRGTGYQEAFRTIRTLVRAMPHEKKRNSRHMRVGIMNAGAPSPGMNTAVRTAVRIGLDNGHAVFRINNGFDGLVKGEIEPFNWMTVNGWAYIGGSELGTNRYLPANGDFYAIARNIEEHNLEALMIIGGWSAYEAALELYEKRNSFPAFNIPIVCFPATIDNDLPGSELSVGADTALNSIVDAIDKIKQSAVASRRVFVVEVLGGTCGYLALMGAMATGAERVYLNEEGVTLTDLREDVEDLVKGFQEGKRLGLVIRNEKANETYSAEFMQSLFEEEGKGLFSSRRAILGHLQQGGNPTPFDRILGSRLSVKCIQFLEEQVSTGGAEAACIGLVEGKFDLTDFQDAPRMIDVEKRRAKDPWWLQLRPVARVMAKPGVK